MTATAILNTKYKSKNGTYPIVIRVIDGKLQKSFSLGYKVLEKHFTNGQVVNHPEADIINSVIDEELLKAKRYYADCRIKNIPPDMSLIFAEVKSHSFTDYLRHRAKQHLFAGQIEMNLKANRFVKELVKCFGREVYFNEVTQDFLRTYDTWLKDQGNISNTRHKKFEFIGKYYGNAITEGKALAPNPFKLYKIKTTPVRKEKLTVTEIKTIEDLPLAKGHLRLSRDLFLFSYYCKGLRFENCLTMPKTAIKDGRIYYTINKGYKHLSTLIHPRLQAVIDRHIDNPTDTIFGRLSLEDIKDKAAKRSIVGSDNAYINKGLKDVAKLAGVSVPVSMHIARHSFAFHLKQVTQNIHAIKDSLGHTKTSTTENYLQSLDDEYLDAEVGKLYNV